VRVKSPKYVSAIPRDARERVIGRHPDGTKRTAEYRLGRDRVGLRCFFESGEPERECGMRRGKKHGTEYDWIVPGVLCSAEPFVDGLPHGTARQWDEHGRLIGTYRMVRGSGIDLWRQRRQDGKAYLSEVLYLKSGLPDGFQWWIEEDQKRVYVERHWRDGRVHGIERQWNHAGRLRRGFPQYHVNGELVTKRRYLKASASDPTLPPFFLHENNPARTFPPEIGKHLQP
jgi:antitoxin component YwqK of YwqJK toxin-antitoxin module